MHVSGRSLQKAVEFGETLVGGSAKGIVHYRHNQVLTEQQVKVSVWYIAISGFIRS